MVMTQSALDAYALANGYSKTTAKMSEMEKVALRYKFVQDQLSAASGDLSGRLTVGRTRYGFFSSSLIR